MVKDEPLMPLAGSVRIRDREDGTHAEGAGCEGEIAEREVGGREEPPRSVKVTATRQEADSMIRAPHVPCDAQQGLREIEEPLAFPMIEPGRRVERPPARWARERAFWA